MKKKGFTLIELLAVILILGIIALIAIPTVNNILKEARQGAFKASSDNIMKSMEEACQTSLIKGERPNLYYTFLDGKTNFSLNVKGTMPDDGYVFLNNECTVTDFYLTDKINVYSSSEDFRKDLMLKASTETETSIFKTMYSSYFDKIVKVSFVDNLNISENAIEVKDPSMSEKGKIKSWLEPDGENYHLYIGSENKIFANYDSSYLMNGFTIATHININNLNTDFTENMTYMFGNCEQVETLNVANFNTFNVTNMDHLFGRCSKLKSLNLSNWDTRNVNNMFSLFALCRKLENPNVYNWDTSNVENMSSLFYCCESITSLDLSRWDTAKTKSLDMMFFCCEKLLNLNVANWNTSNVRRIYSMFFGCKKLKNININNWDVSKVTEMWSLFVGCAELESIDLSKWNTSSVTSATGMFKNCYVLSTIDISNFTFSASTNITDFFNENNNNIINIKAKADTINKIIDYIPNRIGVGTGTITINGDSSGLDTTTLSGKNWNII